MSQVMQVLERMKLFEGLDPASLQQLEKLVFVNRIGPGEMVCREGDSSDFICFVVKGCLDIAKHNAEGQNVVIAHLRPGDSMGEMTLVDRQPRSASVQAVEDSTLIVLTRKAFEQLRKRNPHAAGLVMENIAKLLCANLRRTSSQLAQFMLPLG